MPIGSSKVVPLAEPAVSTTVVDTFEEPDLDETPYYADPRAALFARLHASRSPLFDELSHHRPAHSFAA